MRRRKKQGRLEVITGCMFCGKTEELIRQLRRHRIARQRVQVFKPAIDDRYGTDRIASHSGADFEAVPVDQPMSVILTLAEGTTVVGLDEAQFFGPEIVVVVEDLISRGLLVVVAGLNQDFRGQPFGVMPELMARADELTLLPAVCMICGGVATRTQRLIDGKPARFDEPVVLVGGAESYEARCRIHHYVPGKPKPGSGHRVITGE